MGLDVGEIGMGADLSLDLKMFAAKSLGRVREAPAAAMDDCIRRLEEEKSKIEVFRRELPLCARLLADVIDVMKKEVEEKKRGGDRGEDKEDAGAGDKSNWMSTAQLWTGDSVPGDDASEKQGERRRSSEPESRDGAALPFKAVGSGAPAFAPPSLRKDDKAVGMPDLPFLSPAPIKTSPAAATGGAEESRRQLVGFEQEAARAAAALAPAAPSLSLQAQSQQTAQQQQQQQQARKARRCWSPELHRQFVTALHQLGGPQVATPKQIRELMKVDGLTNDEVKSHLQKYRLHNRRAPGSPAANRPIVLMGGLWITQEQSSSQSGGSPPGPLNFSSSGVAASSVTVSGEEEDGRSESYGWK
ncbi:transcription factor NIGTH1-like [Triticum dicoccoides]|uniref:HTH myb-type domain-containing protein n=1 Tax=Triticum turgidum subsp. durum TaxID=4567 RepID=A0A9R1PNY1_TRITD|nr:transcription factor NIGTH1-like [Triticum dicoccoides]VAH46474.1 unnamed protein product [Triticum turgidum subsp. durum]